MNFGAVSRFAKRLVKDIEPFMPEVCAADAVGAADAAFKEVGVAALAAIG